MHFTVKSLADADICSHSLIAITENSIQVFAYIDILSLFIFFQNILSAGIVKREKIYILE